jgi:cobalt-zinc-cadmium efflux system protein
MSHDHHSHSHSHSHDGDDHHHHGGHSESRMLAIATWITLGFMVFEFSAGVYAQSLALIADAGHMLTDSAALILAWLAVRIASRPRDARRSFGYQRFRVLATFINGFALLGIVAWILIEALMRLRSPAPVNGTVMLWTACAGAVVNLAILRMLHKGDQKDMNTSAVSLHVLSDLLGSVAAIIAAIVILTTGWLPIDPLLSLVVCGLVVRGAWSLVRKSTHILLEGAPDWLDVTQLRQTLERRVPAICDVHHVHAWMVGPHETLLTMHALVQADADYPSVLSETKAVLEHDYGITHATIQLEFGGCKDPDCR